MWRAQPLLSGVTNPAGSKTSCCELCFLWIFSLLCSLISFSTFAPWVFLFFSPASSFQTSASLYPLFKQSHDSVSLFTPPTSASSSFSLALPRCLSSLQLFSQPWVSPSPFFLSLLSLVFNVTLWSSTAKPPYLVRFRNNFPLSLRLLTLLSRHRERHFAGINIFKQITQSSLHSGSSSVFTVVLRGIKC